VQEQSEATKIPGRVLIILFVAIILSLTAILMATIIIDVYPDIAWVLLIFGAIGAIMSGYTLLQLRQRVIRTKIETPPVTTTLECKACGIKSTREFQRGDYIFKEGELCQKCKGKTLITAIFREVKEKEKEQFTV
jgi:hypothetical protein